MNSIIKVILATAFAVGLSSTVSAEPAGKGSGTFKPGTYKHADTQEEIQKLKPGYHYALVCMECKSVTVKEVKDEKEAEALCHEGGTLHCDACKKKVTIKTSGTPGKGTTSKKVTYLNEEGKECMFVVPVKD
jgi:hypothetical protein